MSRTAGRALRFALGVVALAAPLVPAARRLAWRHQWTADLHHQAAFLDTRQPGAATWFEFVWRARGALVHAVVLRVRSFAMPTFFADIRYGARLLTRRPGFAVVAILLIALGIGANGAIFSWVENFLMRPIPGATDAGALASVRGTTLTFRDRSTSYPNFADMRDRLPPSVVGLTAYRAIPLTVRVGDEAERAWGELAAANIFDVVGVRPLHGRLLQPDDDRAPLASPVAVVSHAYWLRRFGGDPAVVGRTVGINGTPFTIVGITPPAFRGASTGLALDLWVPMMMQTAVYPGDRLGARGNAWLAVLARLAPGVDAARAERDLNVVAADLAREHLDLNADRGVAVYALWRDPQSAAAIMGPVLGLLLVVTGIVLVIVCANVASLLLARGAVRRREIAIRLAIGASRTRIVRQLLTESSLLAMAGGAVGLLASGLLSRALYALIPPTPLPIATVGGYSLRVVLVSLALAMATTIVFGLVPALQTSRPALVPTLKDGGGASGANRRRLRSSIVAGQVALSVLLLVAAGLFVRTLQHAGDVDPGFDLRQGLLASIDLLPAGYDQTRGQAFLGDVIEEIQRLPGVEAAAFARDIPLTLGTGGSDTSVEVEGYVLSDGEEISIGYDLVTPDLFRTLGVPLVAGRVLTDADRAGAEPVIIINRAMAERYWPGQPAVGRRIRVAGWRTVVGVVENVSYRGLAAPPQPYMYFPLYDVFRPDMTLLVRTAGEPRGVVDGVRRAIRSRDANVPVFDVRTMAEHRALGSLPARLSAVMLGGFGTVALLLSGIGLFGLLAHRVAERTPEIGIRLALGAEPSRIVRLVVGEGLRLAAAGAAVGLAGAALVLPLASSQLLGVSARDAATYAVVSTVLLAGAALASWLPARRAAGVDPVRAIRHD
ncbi:MAG TPA: ABC transporter permease [Vicinamibacterales bacterium]|nr:ABC transporter permease [Vicinamibacterales bacterium]